MSWAGPVGPNGASGNRFPPPPPISNAQLRINHHLARRRLNFSRNKGWEERVDLIIAVRDIETEMKRRGLKFHG